MVWTIDFSHHLPFWHHCFMWSRGCVCVVVCVYVCVSWHDDSGQSAGSLSCQPVTHWQICCSYTVQATPYWRTHRMCVCVCVSVSWSYAVWASPEYLNMYFVPKLLCVCLSDKTQWQKRPLIYQLFKIILPLDLHFSCSNIWQWQKIEEHQGKRGRMVRD